MEAKIRIWCHDEEIKDICSTLVDFMPKRISMLIKAKEGYINY